MTELHGRSGEKPGPETGEVRLPPNLRKQRFTTPETETYLKEAHGLPVAASTLEKWRTQGKGPRFQSFGRAVFYSRNDLDAWVSERLSGPRKSTSDEGGGQ